VTRKAVTNKSIGTNDKVALALPVQSFTQVNRVVDLDQTRKALPSKLDRGNTLGGSSKIQVSAWSKPRSI
jgi:hypothetical protein